MIREIHVHIAFGVKALRGVMTAGLLAALSAPLGSESLTLTTYYPAPMGIYKKMTTTGQTVLARDGGNVGIGTASHPADLNVTGTSGAYYLQVNKSVRAGDICASTGLVARDSGGLLLSCQAGVWKVATGGGGAGNGGGFTFNSPGYTNLFYGIGQYDSVAGKFYGFLMCDPATTVGHSCGYGVTWCGTNTSCALNSANSGSLAPGATAIPATNVTQKW